MDDFDNYSNVYDPLYALKKECGFADEVLDSCGLGGHTAGLILQKRFDFVTYDVIFRVQSITKTENGADVEYAARVTELRVAHSTPAEAMACYGAIKQGNFIVFDSDKIFSVLTGKFED